MIRRNECKVGNKRLNGMTLIELMIAVSIVAILAAIAYPSYQSYVLKSYRAKAIADLSKIQLKLESSYNSGYNWSGIISGSNCSVCDTPSSRYVFSIASQAGKAYVIKAEAQSGSGQTKDKCLTDESVDYMTLDATNAQYPEDCWI
ncbi:prepilin-type N-terminal cleavage/methylation domain-containing protein [Vibrio sp. MarTm2]|uniref:type IV pilin protein n=1 Tax=Vibrio sp. MarTm2 TaxID=2998831 RepID=UPI0022CD8A18|nr:type IV pilin protein [Vibrio sp. MarTm2]MDA0127351.1 prepilin-type N-terminal cleavage/methylation domain-containing protein [Vibrio sp. MarTm2]